MPSAPALRASDGPRGPLLSIPTQRSEGADRARRGVVAGAGGVVAGVGGVMIGVGIPMTVGGGLLLTLGGVLLSEILGGGLFGAILLPVPVVLMVVGGVLLAAGISLIVAGAVSIGEAARRQIRDDKANNPSLRSAAASHRRHWGWELRVTLPSSARF